MSDRYRFMSASGRAIRRRLRGIFGYQTLSRYVANPSSLHLPAAYILLEYVSLDRGVAF
jgi:hypothetical protein